MSLFVSIWLLTKYSTVSSQCMYISQTFSSTLKFNANVDNNCIIDSCIFENINGNAIEIAENTNITIKNCNITNVTGNAIQLTEPYYTQNILIEHNNFNTIGGNAIVASNHNNVIIQNNEIHNVYNKDAILFLFSSASNGSIIRSNTISNVYADCIHIGAYHRNITIDSNIMWKCATNNDVLITHGILMQAPGATITKNHIFNVTATECNAIAMHSYGTVSNNILHDVTKRGITYWPGLDGYDGELIIENNIIYNVGINYGGIGLSASLVADPNGTLNIGHAIIRFNTVISSVGQVAIEVKSNVDWKTDIYGNIAIRSDGNKTQQFISNFSLIESKCNLETHDANMVGFVNFNTFDLHLSHSSIAIGYCSGYDLVLPQYDIDGNPRGQNQRIDVGADRFTTACFAKIFDNKTPNCATNTFYIKCVTNNECVKDTQPTIDAECITINFSVGYDFWAEIDCMNQGNGCYITLWDSIWPHCTNIALDGGTGCFDNMNMENVKTLCDNSSECIGFTYGSNGGGCWKKDELCVENSFGLGLEDGYYYAKCGGKAVEIIIISPAPTFNPTQEPTYIPTINPTNQPIFAPTINPTSQPVFAPTINPTISPIPNISNKSETIKTTENAASVEQYTTSVIIETEIKEQNNTNVSVFSNIYMTVILFIASLLLLCVVIALYLYKRKLNKIKNDTEMVQLSETNKSNVSVNETKTMKTNDINCELSKENEFTNDEQDDEQDEEMYDQHTMITTNGITTKGGDINDNVVNKASETTGNTEGDRASNSYDSTTTGSTLK